jgi:predicted rRNA methylase YqxC with S4 and FtsJ domains
VSSIDERSIPETVDLITVDLSYLPVADAVCSLRSLRLSPRAGRLALIKPTFELRSRSLVTDAADIHRTVGAAVEGIEAAGWPALACTLPAATGSSGAIEAFVLACQSEPTK